MTATITAPAELKLQWNIQTPITFTLKDSTGASVSTTGVTCTSVDTVALTIAADCSTAKAQRLGNQQISINKDGKTGLLTVPVIPQRHPISHGSSSGNGSGTYNLVSNSAGDLLSWGSNYYGRLGQNASVITLPSLSLPTLVKDSLGTGSITKVVQSARGGDAAFALSETGNVFSWGTNDFWELGYFSSSSVYLPGLVSNSANNGSLSGIVQIAAGGALQAALSEDGRVFVWGYATSLGNSGAGNNYSNRYAAYLPNPANTGDLTGIVSVSVGSNYGLALANDGKVYAWGRNSNGQAGRGTTSTNPELLSAPVLTAANTPLSNIVSISAGYENGMALSSSGNVYVWGSGGAALGQGGSSNANAVYAVKVKTSTGADFSGISAIAAGGGHMLALTNAGTVWSWGRSTSGQLGDGLSSGIVNQSFVPVPVVQVAGTGQLGSIIAIKSGYNHSLALTSSGQVLIWGDGFGGNLGQGTASTANLRVPTPVKDTAGTGTLSVGTLGYFRNLLNLGR